MVELNKKSNIVNKMNNNNNMKQLTFKEESIFSSVYVDLGKLANAYLLRVAVLDLGLLVETVAVGAKSPWLELLLTEGNANRNRELLVGSLGQGEFFR